MWKHARRFDGQIMAALMMTYPLARSTIEQFRGDTLRGTDYFGFLSTSQVVSLPVLAAGLLIIAWKVRGGVEAEQEFIYEDAELGAP